MNTRIYLNALLAWKRYHKNASQNEIDQAKKRIAKLLGEKS